MQQGPVVHKKTQKCGEGDEYWSVAHGTAAGQLSPYGGALKHITGVAAADCLWDKWTEERRGQVIKLILTLFSDFHPSPPLEEVTRLSNVQRGWVGKQWHSCDRECVFLYQQLCSQCGTQTDDIKTSNTDHALSILLCPDHMFPVPDLKGTERVGEQPALRIL